MCARFLESVAPTWELKNEARATHTSYGIPVSNMAAGWLQYDMPRSQRSTC